MKNKTYHLYRWKVIELYADRYSPPEMSTKVLSGFRDQETEEIVTSTLIDVKGTTVTTYSGSTYLLQDIDPEYLKWLMNNNINYDPINPITLKK